MDKMTWGDFMKQSIYDHLEFGDGTSEIGRNGVNKMNEAFGSELIENIRKFQEALAKGFEKQKPVNALLMDNVIYNNDDDSESAVVTFDGSCLEVTSRDSGFCLILDTDEILSVIAFALDNGLQLPQNEDDNEKRYG